MHVNGLYKGVMKIVRLQSTELSIEFQNIYQFHDLMYRSSIPALSPGSRYILPPPHNYRDEERMVYQEEILRSIHSCSQVKIDIIQQQKSSYEHIFWKM